MSKIIFEDNVVYKFGKVKKPKDDWTKDKIELNTAGDGAVKIFTGQWLKQQNIFDSDDFYHGRAVELGLFPPNTNIAICTERNGKLRLETENTVTGNKMTGLNDMQNNSFFNATTNLTKEHQHYLKAEIEKKEEKIRYLEKLIQDRELDFRNQIDRLRQEKYEKEAEIIKTGIAQARLEAENKSLTEQLKLEREARKELEADAKELTATLNDDNRLSTMVTGVAQLAPVLSDVVKMIMSSRQAPMPPQGYNQNGYNPNGYQGQMMSPQMAQAQQQINAPSQTTDFDMTGEYI